MTEKIRVVVKEPHRPAEIREVEPDHRAFNQIVGGYIEFVRLTTNVGFYANEEGLLKDLPYNIYCNGQPIAGAIVVVRYDAEGNELSLSEEDAKTWVDKLNQMAIF